MDLYPAIDLRHGGAVRLVQGDFARERAYGDPVHLADTFAAAGVPWLHVVDLEAARTGRPVERPLVLALARRSAVPVQSGGGVRTVDDVAALVDGGIRRVVVGTVALEDPGVLVTACARYPGQIALGLDYRRDGERLVAAGRGWTTMDGPEVGQVLATTASQGIAAIVATAIDRDGTLTGPDLDGLARILSATEVPVVASGGVGSRADLEALAALAVDGKRLDGVIVGRALVDGRVGLEEAMQACAQSG